MRAVRHHRAVLAERQKHRLGAPIDNLSAARQHILFIDNLSAQRILQLVEIGLCEIHARFQRRKKPCALRVHDLQGFRVHTAEQAFVIVRGHAAGQAARNDGDVAAGGKHLHHIDQLGRLSLADLLAYVVYLGEHGFIVDKLIVFPYAALVPHKRKRHALFVKRVFKHIAVFVVHQPRGVRFAAEPCHADRNVERFSRKGKRLAFDDVRLSDVEGIEFYRDVRTGT